MNCKVCALADQLKPDEWRELLAVLANGRTHNTTVSTILSRHGYGISEATIRRHRGHS